MNLLISIEGLLKDIAGSLVIRDINMNVDKGSIWICTISFLD